jgi:predicted ATPase
MSRIRIKNFGPIKEGYIENNGFMEINKVTVFIGNQGSGKSTVAKVISVLTWLEKAINRGDVDVNMSLIDFENFFIYQRIKNYFRANTEIEYIGKIYRFNYSKKLTPPEIERLEVSLYSGYRVPKIMYVPAERNFLTVIKNPYSIKGLPETLETFAVEYRNSQLKFNDELLPLPIGDVSYKYNNGNETSVLVGKNYKIDLLESSSGYQSLVPLYLVTKFLSDILEEGGEQLDITQKLRKTDELDLVLRDKSLSHKELLDKAEEINARYLNTCFVNIVEEPELNLFPSSQWEILKRLLYHNNIIPQNRLILTTHSPYIINYLTLAVEAHDLNVKIKTKDLRKKLKKIVPIDSMVDAKDLVIYELDEIEGTISKLSTYEGIPSDDNYLNNSLAEGNRLFDALLEIQQEI